MPHTLHEADPNQESLREAADRIRLQAQAMAADSERERRLGPGLIDALRDSGLMRCGAPEALGAAQAPPAVSLECAETIARGDAATGWCVSIALTSSLLAAYLPEKGAAETFGDPRAIAAGVWAPRAKARPVDGGVVVSGRWSFCSGITHADYFFGGCVLDDGRGDKDGAPTLRAVGIPAEELRIVDTWHTSGLRATGSHDVVAEEVFVPAHRVLALDDGPLIDAPLYRFPIYGYFALSIAAAALGNARGAIDDLMDLAGHKVATGSRRTLAEKATTQAAVGQAEAALRAARAFFYSAIDDAWQAACTADEVALGLRTGLRLAAAHAARTSAEVVRAMYDLGGGSAVYESSPLQRRFRDATTATAHLQVSPATWETTGRILLGLPTNVAAL
ncbi:acyl-CoA dehydrogenase family protein [Streptomyces violaceusniger]|uniref:Acyl-CoA dehydrogenase type 2 domain-containing protein n=1 Tax=Streptomyces violaceusniger (strain Tu 4113) TaxID=653045 RepID=G2P3M4_STRV4|nr:acyl-CoA dehydrogenase family protein [Streptomyces violaceusniger]AEM84359.1 Acyl-CoA dehydrogenase type 2 domain-containing protein [Streptomyces violaceusniger Tu 4113]